MFSKYFHNHFIFIFIFWKKKVSYNPHLNISNFLHWFLSMFNPVISFTFILCFELSLFFYNFNKISLILKYLNHFNN
jgi:hypothetical protein